MAASSKKRKEKKADFQKTKLKVGKAKPKPSNVTDTSFKAKAITVKQQTLHIVAPSASAQFDHYLSLLSHPSDSQKRDALAFLTTAVSSRSEGQRLLQPIIKILQTSRPRILDGASSVRSQLLKFYQALPADELGPYADVVLLTIRAGVTHLSDDIKSSSLDFLDWLVQVGGDEVVSCAGGWVKTLQCFVVLLGWQDASTTSKWRASAKPIVASNSRQSKLAAKQMLSLATLLRAGLGESEVQREDACECWPLIDAEAHVISKRSTPYAYLNLFGAPRNKDTEMYEDREDRQRVFHEMFEQCIQKGLDKAKSEGGEIGRASAQIRRAMNNGMSDYAASE